VIGLERRVERLERAGPQVLGQTPSEAEYQAVLAIIERDLEITVFRRAYRRLDPSYSADTSDDRAFLSLAESGALNDAQATITRYRAAQGWSDGRGFDESELDAAFAESEH
jgi:hypothetical protein